MKLCSIDDCDKEVLSRDWCPMHYQRWRKYGDPLAPHVQRRNRQTPECIVDGCQTKPWAKNLCGMHYGRFWRTGDAGEAESRTHVGEDAERVHSNGYVVLGVTHPDNIHKRNCALQHRVVMEQILGRPLRSDESVHHKNGDRTDNRPENLELWSRYQPAGQRAEDKLAWAYEIIELYGKVFKN